MAHIAAGQIMRFKRIASNIQTRFHCRDAIVDNQSDRHFPQPHADHFPMLTGAFAIRARSQRPKKLKRTIASTNAKTASTAMPTR